MPALGTARRRKSKAERPDENEVKRIKIYDEDTISANLKAVFPNWTPEDPMFMLTHGFAEPEPIPRKASSSSASAVKPKLGRRNTGHDIPEIREGPYSDFLDTHGSRAEYFPHEMMKQLEADRKRKPSQRSPTSSPDSLASFSSSSIGNGSGQCAYVVVHSQKGGYNLNDTAFRLQGVFASLENANVKALELFQKQHRNFMLNSYEESPGQTAIPFVQQRGPPRITAVNDCEASWWIDIQGRLSLRAANWGSGDGRIFVTKQEFQE
ncbi:hypothetical protein F4780DRAFT_36030 [Xylariomycetidae sp. FL0641]|nr:hypothetical protein F4780DRAFT_36030 [Xylariomycetidae sp. FL0641]